MHLPGKDENDKMRQPHSLYYCCFQLNLRVLSLLIALTIFRDSSSFVTFHQKHGSYFPRRINISSQPQPKRTPVPLLMKISSTTSAINGKPLENDIIQKDLRRMSTSLDNTKLLNDNPPRRIGRPIQTVRSVDWCGSRGMLPWQKYHVRTLYASHEETHNNSTNHDSLEEMMKMANASSNFNLSTVSRSSKHLLDKVETLTVDEQRRLYQKIQVEQRASTPLNRTLHYYPIYKDEHLVVVNKPNRILCVPGPRRNPSLANLVHGICFGSEDNEYYNVDKMVIHRLDMDTSGVVAYALSERALSILHDDFRHRQVKKTYQALVCGHIPIAEGEIDLPLERDPLHPPFMRIAVGNDNNNNNVGGGDNENGGNSSTTVVHEGFQKFIQQAPKPSLTTFRVLSWEYMSSCRLPVTRVELTPYTGRTHQLRVHCAGMGHPIVGDDIYGYFGEGAPNAGLDNHVMNELYPQRCNETVQKRIYDVVQSTNQALCLHAKQLYIHHPISRAPMVFEADPPF